jgi:acyl carrier protein
MDNAEQRLIKVFETVFPDLPKEKLRSASQESVESWDSVAAITLINLIEEEFEMEMDFDDVADLTSFSRILDYLNGRIAPTAA